MHPRLALSVAVLWASAMLLAGQQPPPQTPPIQTPAPTPSQVATFKSSVEAVRLDVSVLDAGRVPVTGLTVDDFMVLEEGRPQKITTFSEISVPDPVEPTTEWMRDVSPDIRRNDDMNDRRLILIVLDDAMISSMNVRFTQNVKTAARPPPRNPRTAWLRMT